MVYVVIHFYLVRKDSIPILVKDVCSERLNYFKIVKHGRRIKNLGEISFSINCDSCHLKIFILDLIFCMFSSLSKCYTVLSYCREVIAWFYGSYCTAKLRP
jgi:hypothetical protein